MFMKGKPRRSGSCGTMTFQVPKKYSTLTWKDGCPSRLLGWFIRLWWTSGMPSGVYSYELTAGNPSPEPACRLHADRHGKQGGQAQSIYFRLFNVFVNCIN